MRRAPALPWMLLLIGCVIGCATDPLEAQRPDAGACPNGGIPGPLGTCLVRDLCDECLFDSDCKLTLHCTVPGPETGGCRRCVPDDVHADCAPPGALCRGATECCGLPCVRPGAPQCGTCLRLEDECADDAGCDVGTVCVEQPPPACACEPRPVRVCRATCQRVPCAEGERCLDSGRCEPVLCFEGFACPPNFDCSPDPLADAHGCAPRACRVDGDCPGGVCVEHRCDTLLGVCSLPPP